VGHAKLLTVVICSLLSSCDRSRPPPPLSPLCGQYDREKVKTVPADMRAVAAAEDCAHHTAAALAGGSDSADVIAAGVMDACSSEIATWVEQATQKSPSDPRDQVARSVRYEVLTQARLEILRHRAGHCPAP
jgi:hypothetical protein